MTFILHGSYITPAWGRTGTEGLWLVGSLVSGVTEEVTKERFSPTQSLPLCAQEMWQKQRNWGQERNQRGEHSYGKAGEIIRRKEGVTGRWRGIPNRRADPHYGLHFQSVWVSIQGCELQHGFHGWDQWDGCSEHGICLKWQVVWKMRTWNTHIVLLKSLHF